MWDTRENGFEPEGFEVQYVRVSKMLDVAELEGYYAMNRIEYSYLKRAVEDGDINTIEYVGMETIYNVGNSSFIVITTVNSEVMLLVCVE